MKKPKISDHAMLRYLERTGRIDLAALEKEILTPDLITALKAGCTKFKVNGFTYILNKGTVVTVVDNVRPRGPGRHVHQSL